MMFLNTVRWTRKEAESMSLAREFSTYDKNTELRNLWSMIMIICNLFYDNPNLRDGKVLLDIQY